MLLVNAISQKDNGSRPCPPPPPPPVFHVGCIPTPGLVFQLYFRGVWFLKIFYL